MHRIRSQRVRRAGPVGVGSLCAEPLEHRLLLAFNPTPDEQYMLELLNRMRRDPASELGHMTSSLGSQARSDDPDIDAALRFFRTSGTVLRDQWASLEPAPPLAWNERLYDAAEFHSSEMIRQDAQEHQLPGEPDLGDRAVNAGYDTYTRLGESIYAYAASVFHGHAGFALDWGDEPDGIQDPPGHRITMMSPAYREVGIRILYENRTDTRVGPLVVTQDFGARYDQGNPYLLGVAYRDGDRDGFYSPGEGLGGVTVRVLQNGSTVATTTTMSAGGWQAQVPRGVYTVVFSGGAFGDGVTYRGVSVGSDNAKLDAEARTPPPQPDAAVEGGGVPIAAGDAAPSLADGTNFRTVVLGRSVTRLFTIRNAGEVTLTLGGATLQRIGAERGTFTIAGLSAGDAVSPGQTRTFAVTYAADRVGPGRARVSIASDDPDTPAYTFDVHARGRNVPVVLVGDIPNGDREPTAAKRTHFQGLEVNTAKRLRSFTITNTGSRPLRLDEGSGGPVTIAGEHAGDFRVASQPARTVLAPGETTFFRVRFNPSEIGTRTAIVRIRSNGFGARVFDFAVAGTGAQRPAPRFVVGGEQLRLTSTPPGHDFGAATVGDARPVFWLTVRNIGSAVLRFGDRPGLEGSGVPGVRLSGEGFEFVRGLPRRIGPGEERILRVRFTPPGPGEFSGVVTLGGNFRILNFVLHGTGV